MKKYKHKIIIEKPRGHSSEKNPAVRKARRDAKQSSDLDSLPTKMAMKPGKSYDRKSFSDNFNHLKRFLAKNCGRPWAKVYSELCDGMDKRNLAKWHFTNHVFDFVTVRPIIVNKIPYHYGYSGSLIEVLGFYVDENGLLKDNDNDKNQRRRDRRRGAAIDKLTRKAKKISNREFYVREKGIWYYCVFRSMQPDQTYFDVLAKKQVSWGSGWTLKYDFVERSLFDNPVYCFSKKQISKKEIKENGLDEC